MKFKELKTNTGFEDNYSKYNNALSSVFTKVNIKSMIDIERDLLFKILLDYIPMQETK